MKCKCQHKREVRFMEYEPDRGTCLHCYGEVDLKHEREMAEAIERIKNDE